VSRESPLKKTAQKAASAEKRKAITKVAAAALVIEVAENRVFGADFVFHQKKSANTRNCSCRRKPMKIFAPPFQRENKVVNSFRVRIFDRSLMDLEDKKGCVEGKKVSLQEGASDTTWVDFAMFSILGETCRNSPFFVKGVYIENRVYVFCVLVIYVANIVNLVYKITLDKLLVVMFENYK